MKNELPFGIGFLFFFFTLTSDMRRGRADTGSIFSSLSSSSSSSSDSLQHLNSRIFLCKFGFLFVLISGARDGNGFVQGLKGFFCEVKPKFKREKDKFLN